METPAIQSLHFRSSVKEVEDALRKDKIFIYDWQYVKDREFEQYVLKDIHTIEQAKAFIAMLNADCLAMGHDHKCQKTWGLSSLKEDVEKYIYLTFANLMSSARRTCCVCHETGSFALSSGYHNGIVELKKRLAARRKKILAKK